MSQAVVDEMIVRMTGEGSDYQKMLQTARDSTAQTQSRIEAATAKIEGFGSKLEGFASSAMSALAAVGLGGGLMGLFQDFAQAEEGEALLRAALQANGREVDSLMGRYNDFAQQIQRVTTTDDDAALSLLRTAETMGLTGAAAERAAKNAIALAAARGIDAASAIRLTAALEHGNAEMLQRQIPTLRGVEDATQQVAIAQAELAKMFGQAEAQAGTSSGMLKQLGNAWGNLKEELGGIVAQALKPVIAGLSQVVSWIQALSPEVKTAAVAVVGLLTAFMAYKAVAPLLSGLLGPLGGVLKAVTSISLIFSPIGLAIAAAAAVIGVFVTKSGGISEAFKEVGAVAGKVWDWIKQKVGAFWDWAKPIATSLKDAFVAAWKAIGDVVSSVWGAIKSAVTTAWKFITDVWKSIFGDAEVSWADIRDTIITTIDTVTFTFQNFGTMIEHVWTGIKLSAVKAWDFIRGVFGGEISDLQKDLQAEFDKQTDGIAEGIAKIQSERKKVADAAAALEPPKPDEKPEDKGKEDGSKYGKAAAAEIKKVDAVLAGSAESISRITDYLERNKPRGEVKTPGSGPGKTVSGGAVVPDRAPAGERVPVPDRPAMAERSAPPATENTQTAMLQLLKDIKDQLIALGKRPVEERRAVGLGGG